jgi:hypothetical protein
LPAISSEPIFSKSRFYIQRALNRKEEKDFDEYQLWASLALELLGKAALAKIHPSLIVDPTHFQSLFAASGLNVSTDIKTIAAHTLFERLRHLAPKFEEQVKTFCNGIAQRRNAELHSGETPFKTMKLEAWEARYWHAAQVILNMMDSSLENWLGASNARAPTQLLEHAAQARVAAVEVRVQQAKEQFAGLSRKVREEALATAESKNHYDYRNLFRLVADEEWEARCPACEGKAFLAGMMTSEEIVDSSVDEDGALESVARYFAAEEFHCPVCDLQMQGSDEIEAAGVSTEHETEEQREQEFEPEYGNC